MLWSAGVMWYGGSELNTKTAAYETMFRGYDAALVKFTQLGDGKFNMQLITNKAILLTFLLTLPAILTAAQDLFKLIGRDSLKGTITKERSWWDVQHYDISLEIDFGKRKIAGRNRIDFNVVQKPHTPFMQIDLQEPLSIDSVKMGATKLQFKRYGAAYIIDALKLDEEKGKLDIYYSGVPKESKDPPYDGGFVWAKGMLMGICILKDGLLFIC